MGRWFRFYDDALNDSHHQFTSRRHHSRRSGPAIEYAA